MSIFDKIKRLRTALNETDDKDELRTIRGVIAGMTAYALGQNKKLAKKRYEDHCKGCAFNVKEPIESMRVNDSELPELSGRMCTHCGGCTLSYKLRQNVKKCEYWK